MSQARPPAPPLRLPRPAVAAVFDLDGVLLDTEKAYTLAADELAARFGRRFDWTIKAQMMGRGAREALAVYIDALALPITVDEAIAAMAARLDAEFARTEAMPHAEAFTAALAAGGVPLAVATSSTRALYEQKTRPHADWFAIFRAVVRADDPAVRAPKPAPDLFLAAARALDVEPSACVAFEDSPAGVEAARAAGMQVVAVPAPELDRARVAGADLIVRHLGELRPEDLGLSAFTRT